MSSVFFTLLFPRLLGGLDEENVLDDPPSSLSCRVLLCVLLVFPLSSDGSLRCLLLRLVSTKSQASWYSPAPLNSLGSAEDVALLAACQSNGNTIQGGCAKLKVERGQPYLVGRTFVGSAVLGLPVKMVRPSAATIVHRASYLPYS